MIIEAALLTDEEKVTACTLVKAAGADYVKTSTGFAKSGATVADVELMRRVVGPEMGVKAAGGVRDLRAGARRWRRPGPRRVGASAGVKIVRESRGETVAQPAAGTTLEAQKRRRTKKSRTASKRRRQRIVRLLRSCAPALLRSCAPALSLPQH